MSSELNSTFRPRLARFFYGLSGIGFLFFVFIALTGGFRFEVFNYPISGTTLDSPLIVCLARGFPWSPDCSDFSLENNLGGEIGIAGSFLGSNAGAEVSTYPAHRCEYPGRSPSIVFILP